MNNRPETLRYLEARVSAARSVYQETGKIAILASLEQAQRQLEEYQYGRVAINEHLTR